MRGRGWCIPIRGCWVCLWLFGAVLAQQQPVLVPSRGAYVGFVIVNASTSIGTLLYTTNASLPFTNWTSVQGSQTTIRIAGNGTLNLTVVATIASSYSAPTVGSFFFIQSQTCGDGVRSGQEACDDGNRIPTDGCSGICTVEAGWFCSTADQAFPSSCECLSGLYGPNCDRPCESSLNCSGFGLCSSPMGFCDCFDKYFGPNCGTVVDPILTATKTFTSQGSTWTLPFATASNFSLTVVASALQIGTLASSNNLTNMSLNGSNTTSIATNLTNVTTAATLQNFSLTMRIFPSKASSAALPSGLIDVLSPLFDMTPVGVAMSPPATLSFTATASMTGSLLLYGYNSTTLTWEVLGDAAVQAGQVTVSLNQTQRVVVWQRNLTALSASTPSPPTSSESRKLLNLEWWYWGLALLLATVLALGCATTLLLRRRVQSAPDSEEPEPEPPVHHLAPPPTAAPPAIARPNAFIIQGPASRTVATFHAADGSQFVWPPPFVAETTVADTTTELELSRRPYQSSFSGRSGE
mmetsp:Transcript_122/g.247  ORF Transcript_122/g.247 Transcript_122/m.247 type:complete len:523 (-) Transcript_122:385-1953(-)